MMRRMMAVVLVGWVLPAQAENTRCVFDFQRESYAGSEVEQARCLLPEFEGNGRVRGTAHLTRRHVGPPGVAHGGVGAMIADQLAAVAPFVLGLTCVTRAMTVRYRRPIPLYRELTLEARCEQTADEAARAWCTISVDDDVVLEAEADMVVAMHVTRPDGRPGRR